jgi:chemotaxis protein CheZ
MNGVLSRQTLISCGVLIGDAAVGERMAEPRKVFRIERTASARLEEAAATAQAGLRSAEILREMRALRAALAALAPNGSRAVAAGHGDVTRLTSELNKIAGAIAGEDAGGGAANGPDSEDAGPPLSRIEHELHAVVSGSEQATQKILASAEEIDTAANNLSATLSGRIEQEAAQDIRDLVIKIYEACNFQDLVGQRVAKVSAALKVVEDHIARVLEEIKTASATVRRGDGHALYGPQLDGDRGHASQSDIDAMFGGRR